MKSMMIEHCVARPEMDLPGSETVAGGATGGCSFGWCASIGLGGRGGARSLSYQRFGRDWGGVSIWIGLWRM